MTEKTKKDALKKTKKILKNKSIYLKNNILKLYKNLQKIESILITQIKIKYIELVIFLNKVKISKYKILTC